MEEKIPQLTLTPNLEEALVLEPVKQEDLIEKSEKAPEAGPDLSMLSEAEQQAVLAFSKQIDLTDTSQVLQYGAAAQKNLASQKQRFIHLTAKLDALSPLKVLARGYSVVLTSDGRVVQRAGQVQIGDQVDIKLHQGSFTASVTQIQEERNGEEITEL